jgi:CO dehydrogenase maturation factor
MKVLVCGKGGSGKSTISAMLAKAMASRGHEVLVVDTDESNYGLHRLLGLELPPDFVDHFGGKKGISERSKFFGENPHGLLERRWNLKDLPVEYLTKKNGIELLSVGKIHHFGEGCGCAMGSLSKDFLINLDLADDQMAIIDTDAGIEHFGRGVEKGVDIVLAVVDPSFESVRLALKICGMAASINKPVYFVLNRVNPEIKKTLLESLESHIIAGAVSMNDEIFMAGLLGQEIAPNSEIFEIAGFLEELNA